MSLKSGHLYLRFSVCENEDVDQLRSNCAADQRLCFRASTLLYARICTSGVPEVTKYTLLPINFWDEFVFNPNHQTMSRIARKPEVIDKKWPVYPQHLLRGVPEFAKLSF